MPDILDFILVFGAISGIIFYPQIYSWALEQDMKSKEKNNE